MLNKTERAEMDSLVRENDSLKQKVERLDKLIEREQDKIATLEELISDVEIDVGARLKKFKRAVVEILTGTPPEDQPS